MQAARPCRSVRSRTFRSSRRSPTRRRSRRRRRRPSQCRSPAPCRRAPKVAPAVLSAPCARTSASASGCRTSAARRRLRHTSTPPPAAAGRCVRESADHHGRQREAIQGHADHARFLRRRSALGAALLQRNQRAEHHHRSVGAGDADRHRAARRSLGPGVRDAAADAQARLRRRRHDRPHRADCGPGRRGRRAPEAVGGEGARRRPAGADLLAELREGRAICSPLLVKSALSQRGQIQVDARTNTIIITDLPDRLQTVSALLGALDRPEPQVEVEARVVQTTREFAKAMGVQWGLNGRVTPAIGNTTGLAFPNNGTLGGRTGADQLAERRRARPANDTTATAVNLGVPGATSAIGLALGAVNGAFNLDVALTALERSGKGRILSTPRLTTQNNVAAEVDAGHPDSDSDGRQQHRHGQLQGRRADAPGDAADHVGQHRDHADHARERDAGLQPSGQRHSADRHAARHARRCRWTTGQRRSSAGSSSAANRYRTSARRCCTACRCSAGCSNAIRRLTKAASC